MSINIYNDLWPGHEKDVFVLYRRPSDLRITSSESIYSEWTTCDDITTCDRSSYVNDGNDIGGALSIIEEVNEEEYEEDESRNDTTTLFDIELPIQDEETKIENWFRKSWPYMNFSRGEGGYEGVASAYLPQMDLSMATTSPTGFETSCEGNVTPMSELYRRADYEHYLERLHEIIRDVLDPYAKYFDEFSPRRCGFSPVSGYMSPIYEGRSPLRESENQIFEYVYEEEEEEEEEEVSERDLILVRKWIRLNEKILKGQCDKDSREWLDFFEFVANYTPPDEFYKAKLTDYVKCDPLDVVARRKRSRAFARRARRTSGSAAMPVAKKDRFVPPIAGRSHACTQVTDDLSREPMAVGTQTDFKLRLAPPQPKRVRAVVGVDVGTEIPHNELFDFAKESKAVVQVLVSESLRAGSEEAAHALEMSQMSKLQEKLQHRRRKERQTVSRLEADEMLLESAKDERLRRNAIAKEMDADMCKEMIMPKVIIDQVVDNADAMVKAVCTKQLANDMGSSLSADVQGEVQTAVESRRDLSDYVRQVVRERAAAYAKFMTEQDETSTYEEGAEEMLKESSEGSS